MERSKTSWWQVRGRGVKIRKDIRNAMSSHEYTFPEYAITITDYDVEAVDSLLGDIRHFGDSFEKRLSRVVHYYITALVGLVKEKRGLKVEWDIEGCRDFGDYIELARKKLEAVEQTSKEVKHETEHKRTDNEEPDFRGFNSELLRLEAHSPCGLET